MGNDGYILVKWDTRITPNIKIRIGAPGSGVVTIHGLHPPKTHLHGYLIIYFGKKIVYFYHE
jgi:hypothetical protein